MTNRKSICAFDWYQNHRPWMTLNFYKFNCSRNFSLVGMFGRQQRLNEWRQTRIVSEGIVAHWKCFSTLYRLRWYLWVILSAGQINELRPIYQGCRALTFALARLSCLRQDIKVSLHDITSSIAFFWLISLFIKYDSFQNCDIWLNIYKGIVKIAGLRFFKLIKQLIQILASLFFYVQ